MSCSIVADLDRFGPQSPPATIAQARRYCARLARSHYENFTVASLLAPRRLRPHLHAVYAYCRWADDLADETLDRQRSLELLDWWETELYACFDGRPRHIVFVALAETVREFSLPKQPFCDLLDAFRQDQTKTRYATIHELLAYCEHSANPVGRIVLHLGRSANAENLRGSDALCTGLQLVNFCQDVARDWDKGRIYLPQKTLADCGCDESAFLRRAATPEFRRALAREVDRAQQYLESARPLVGAVSRDLRLPVELFFEGGLATVAAIRRIAYDVWRVRPTVGRWKKLTLAARAWWRSFLK
jgi:squalene synthase HpnC